VIGKFSGTLNACDDYKTYAGLGWNLSQPRTATSANPQMSAWAVPASGGITITFENPDNAPAWVQVQDATNTAAGRWCAPLTSGVEVPWASLMTNCWTGGAPQSALLPGAEVVQAMVYVTGTYPTTTPFNICLENIAIQ
jgi:hypothetical protein